MKNRFGTAAVQPNELPILAQILREQGFKVEEKRYFGVLPELKVAIPGKEFPVVVAVGYGVFMATDKIPGIKHDFLGEGIFRLALAI